MVLDQNLNENVMRVPGQTIQEKRNIEIDLNQTLVNSAKIVPLLQANGLTNDEINRLWKAVGQNGLKEIEEKLSQKYPDLQLSDPIYAEKWMQALLMTMRNLNAIEAATLIVRNQIYCDIIAIIDASNVSSDPKLPSQSSWDDDLQQAA